MLFDQVCREARPGRKKSSVYGVDPGGWDGTESGFVEVRDDVSFFVELVDVVCDWCCVVVGWQGLWQYVNRPHAVRGVACAVKGKACVVVMHDVYFRSYELHIIDMVAELT